MGVYVEVYLFVFYVFLFCRLCWSGFGMVVCVCKVVEDLGFGDNGGFLGLVLV